MCQSPLIEPGEIGFILVLVLRRLLQFLQGFETTSNGVHPLTVLIKLFGTRRNLIAHPDNQGSGLFHLAFCLRKIRLSLNDRAMCCIDLKLLFFVEQRPDLFVQACESLLRLLIGRFQLLDS